MRKFCENSRGLYAVFCINSCINRIRRSVKFAKKTRFYFITLIDNGFLAKKREKNAKTAQIGNTSFPVCAVA
ncbi:MAG TPA: hypothetical protein DIV38_04300 [Clostridiales bacterium]|nr:hypothetical protein [Clostridiales bacterium]